MLTCLIWQCLTSFNTGFHDRMNAFLQYTHNAAFVFYRIVPLQAVKRGVRGAIVSWITPPAHLSHHPHCLCRDYQGCILSTEDRDQVYFHFSVPPVFSGHVP